MKKKRYYPFHIYVQNNDDVENNVDGNSSEVLKKPKPNNERVKFHERVDEAFVEYYYRDKRDVSFQNYFHLLLNIDKIKNGFSSM